MTTIQKDWTTVGGDYVEQLGGRVEVEAEIERLDWQTIPEGGVLHVGFIPAHAIKKAIAEFRIPRVSQVAVGAIDRPGTGGHDGFYPGLYGIEGNYTNGRARIYILDIGAELVPLRSDLYPEEGR